MNRQDFRTLAELRLKDAQVLLKEKRYDGAYYLAGYSVECALKACIAKQTKRAEFPDKEKANKVHVHNLANLLGLANLDGKLLAAGTTEPGLLDNWNTAKDWRETSRYTRKTKKEATELVAAIASPTDGVMTWIRQHW